MLELCIFIGHDIFVKIGEANVHFKMLLSKSLIDVLSLSFLLRSSRCYAYEAFRESSNL